MRNLGCAIASVLFVAGCVHAPPPAADPFDGYWVDYRLLEYDEVSRDESGVEQRLHTRELRHPIAGGDFDEWIESPAEPAHSQGITGVRAEGVVQLTAPDRTGRMFDVTPVKVLLPVHPRVGLAWDAEHTGPTGSHTRACRIEASDRCEAGLVTDCTTTFERTVVLLRTHFCRGRGVVRQEARVESRTGELRLAFHTENTARDGVPVDTGK